MLDRSYDSALFLNYLLERCKGGFEVFECLFVVHFVMASLFLLAGLYACATLSFCANSEEATITKKPAQGGLRGTTCNLSNLHVSACGNEKHCGQKGARYHKAYHQEWYIRLYSLSVASRFWTFFIWEHIASRLLIVRTREAGSISSTLLLRCLAAGCCEAKEPETKQCNRSRLWHGGYCPAA
jgi:hypothetical protein